MHSTYLWWSLAVLGESHASFCQPTIHEDPYYSPPSAIPLSNLSITSRYSSYPHLLTHVQFPNSHSHWYKLAQTTSWKHLCSPIISTLDRKQFYTLRAKFLDNQFQNLRQDTNSLLLSSSHPTLELDPILYLPMTTSERSRVLRWRLGWLPGGKPKECIFHPSHNWSRRHAIECLHVHNRLYIPTSVEDPISFLLNLLPLHKPHRPSDCTSWYTLWPILCTILHKQNYYFHYEFPPKSCRSWSQAVELAVQVIVCVFPVTLV